MPSPPRKTKAGNSKSTLTCLMTMNIVIKVTTGGLPLSVKNRKNTRTAQLLPLKHHLSTVDSNSEQVIRRPGREAVSPIAAWACSSSPPRPKNDFSSCNRWAAIRAPLIARVTKAWADCWEAHWQVGQAIWGCKTSIAIGKHPCHPQVYSNWTSIKGKNRIKRRDPSCKYTRMASWARAWSVNSTKMTIISTSL